MLIGNNGHTQKVAHLSEGVDAEICNEGVGVTHRLTATLSLWLLALGSTIGIV